MVHQQAMRLHKAAYLPETRELLVLSVDGLVQRSESITVKVKIIYKLSFQNLSTYMPILTPLPRPTKASKSSAVQNYTGKCKQ